MPFRCPVCSKESRPGQRFCPHCGTPVFKVCPSCRAENDAEASFCGSCGSGLAKPSSSPPPGRPSEPAAPRGPATSHPPNLLFEALILKAITCQAPQPGERDPAASAGGEEDSGTGQKPSWGMDFPPEREEGEALADGAAPAKSSSLAWEEIPFPFTREQIRAASELGLAEPMKKAGSRQEVEG